MKQFCDVYSLAADAHIIGEGSFGVVYCARRKTTGELFAMKAIELDPYRPSKTKDIRIEIEIQKGLTHPNICRLYESFEEEGMMCVVMELCLGGTLTSRLMDAEHGFEETYAATLLEKMLSAVLYCHHNGVVHRDIKLDNFIFESSAQDAEIKLIDFGFAECVTPGDEAMLSRCGTPSYMAPELWPGFGNRYYTSAVDCWALGAVAYMMISGKKPFHHSNKRQKQRLIQHAPLTFCGSKWARVSDECKDFVSGLLRKDPHERLSAAEALSHAWVRSKSKLRSGAGAALELCRRGEIVGAVEQYCDSGDSFRRLVLESMAFCTPPSRVDSLRSMFVAMDVDDSGTISLAEFKQAMDLRPEISARRAELLFERMDLNCSGDVDYLEFLSATISSRPPSPRRGRCRAQAAFSILDRDGDGFIGAEDLALVAKGAYSEAEVGEMLAAHGTDGRIDFGNFQKLVEHVIGASPSRNADVALSRESACSSLSSRISQAEADVADFV